MKKTLLAVFLSAISVMNVNAADKFGYLATRSLAGGERDSLLRTEDLNAAFLEGARSTGSKIDVGTSSMPLVVVEYTTLYVPGLNNLRTVVGNITLRDEAVVRGKFKNHVGVCQYAFDEWRAGPSVQMHVSSLLDSARAIGVKFAKDCLK